jgi:guanosine-3',5'-bis(diphosphate) 3'-pyrophosphohydrolase
MRAACRLLHDVVEDTRCTVDDVRHAFGEEVAEMVAALTENSDISPYAQRKRALRASIIAAGSPVVDVAIADKIASLRHAQITRSPVTDRKLRHYRLTLQLALIAGLAPVLCGDMQSLLAELARF